MVAWLGSLNVEGGEFSTIALCGGLRWLGALKFGLGSGYSDCLKLEKVTCLKLAILT